MDSKDRQIIRALQHDGRMTNQDLADKVNLSPSPCLRRLRNLEQSGAIKSYSPDVDAKAYGLPVTVFVRVTLENHTEDTVAHFERQVKDTSEVLECYVMTGMSDYLLRVIVADLDNYESFVRNRLHRMGTIRSIDTSFVYGTVKKTAVFPALS